MNESALDDAKKDALAEVSSDEPVVDEAVEEETEEMSEVEEGIDDGLPQEHKERSNLGRKVSALLNKSDKTDEILSRMQETIEIIGGRNQEPNYEDDEPLTRADLRQMEVEKTNVAAAYENNFRDAFHELSAELPEKDKVEIGGILMSNYNTKASKNGSLDGAKAFHNAYNEYYGKKTPLQHKKASGVSTKQTVKKRERPLAKLDAATASYLNSIKRDRGDDVALRLHKEL